MNFSTPLFWKISTLITADIMIDKQFSHVDSVIGTRRDDFGMTYGVIFSRPLVGPLTAQMHYHYYKTDSNQAFFDSNRHIAGLTLSVSY